MPTVSIADRLGPDKFEQYKKILKKNVKVSKKSASKTVDEVWEKLEESIGERTIRGHMKEIKDYGDLVLKPTGEAAEGESFKVKIEPNKQEIESYSERIKTPEQALAKAGLSLKEWAIDRAIINSWEVGAKLPSGKIVTTPLWQVKLFLSRKKAWNMREFTDELVKHINVLPPRSGYSLPEVEPQPIMGVLCLFDAHIGSLSWAPESGENYDMKIAEQRFMEIASSLIKRAALKGVEQIVFPTGNDLLHSDFDGKTTGGTQLDNDGRAEKQFIVASRVVIETIKLASEVCDVVVPVVRGNHDESRSFMLGEVVRHHFNAWESVDVRNEPTWRTYHKYGVNLLGFTHGDRQVSDKKRTELVQTMCSECSDWWAETKCREWLLGHVHHETSTVHRIKNVDSVRDVVIRTLPSVAATDAWHHKENYSAVRAGEVIYYHKERGRYGSDTFQVL